MKYHDNKASDKSPEKGEQVEVGLNELLNNT